MSLMSATRLSQKKPSDDIILISKAKERTENLRSAYLAKLHYNLFKFCNFVFRFFQRLKKQRLEFEEGKNSVSAW